MTDFGPNGYAICEPCGLEMHTHGCTIDKVDIDGHTHQRLPYNARFDGIEGQRCHDCSALPGQYHHWGCDMERCPACGYQLISCECQNVSVLVMREEVA